MAVDNSQVAHIKATTNALHVPVGSWVEAKSGSIAIESRKQVIIFNRSPRTLYWSFDNTIGVKYANAIRKGAYFSLNLSNSVPLYLRADTGTARVIVNELS
jgi:hypothetical protein